MQLPRSLIIASGLYFLHAYAQVTLNPTSCLFTSGVSSFSACNYLTSQISYCSGPQVATGAPQIACYCNQKMFNAFYDCDSEVRLCFEDDSNDPVLQSAIGSWHSVCDKEITFSPTTPGLASLTTTYNSAFCDTAAPYCASAIAVASECTLSYTAGAKLSSCTCQPELLLLQYTCLYQVNTTCLAQPAVLTNIPAYSSCANGPSVFASANSPHSSPASAAATPTSPTALSSNSVPSSPSSSTPTTTGSVSPGSSSEPPSAHSTSSSAASESVVDVSVRHVGILVSVILLWNAGLIIV